MPAIEVITLWVFTVRVLLKVTMKMKQVTLKVYKDKEPNMISSGTECYAILDLYKLCKATLLIICVNFFALRERLFFRVTSSKT
jgi:hypothetical protein